MKFPYCVFVALCLLSGFSATVFSGDVPAEDDKSPLKWSEAVVARAGSTQLVSYQATVASNWLIIQAKHNPAWHTYAMDNAQRATAALKGKASLGVEEGMTIEVRGVDLEGDWQQSRPKDFSRPELRWFTFGFDGTAYFTRRIKVIHTNKPVVVRLQGQACSGTTCRQVDVTMKVEPQETPDAQEVIDAVKTLRKTLVPVHRDESEVAAAAE